MSNPSTPHGLHGLTVLDDETIEWLFNTCPEILCGHAVVVKNCNDYFGRMTRNKVLFVIAVYYST